MTKTGESSGLTAALEGVIQRIHDPLFLLLLGVAILLVVAASVRTNWEVMAIVGGSLVLMFCVTLLYLNRESERSAKHLLERVTSRVTYCIKKEGYLSGTERQHDFAAILVGKIGELRKQHDCPALRAMIDELVGQFDIADELYQD